MLPYLICKMRYILLLNSLQKYSILLWPPNFISFLPPCHLPLPSSSLISHFSFLTSHLSSVISHSSFLTSHSYSSPNPYLLSYLLPLISSLLTPHSSPLISIFKNLPVSLSGLFATSCGVPVQITFPPAEPPSGPMSMI